MALVSRRVATIYSAIVSGEPIPPAYFGLLQDLVDCEPEYEACTDYLDDQTYWSNNLLLDTAALWGVHELTITGFTNREYNHYPLSVQAVPGNELCLRVEFDIKVFTAARIEKLADRFRRVLEAMTADMRDKP